LPGAITPEQQWQYLRTLPQGNFAPGAMEQSYLSTLPSGNIEPKLWKDIKLAEESSVASFLGGLPDGDKRLYDWERAKAYEPHFGVDRKQIFADIERYDTAFFGSKTFPKTEVKAIIDSGHAAALGIAIGKKYSRINGWDMPSRMGAKASPEEIDRLQKEIEAYQEQAVTLQTDLTPRDWFVDFMKMFAGAGPYIGKVAAEGAAISLAIAAAAKTMGVLAPGIGATAAAGIKSTAASLGFMSKIRAAAAPAGGMAGQIALQYSFAAGLKSAIITTHTFIEGQDILSGMLYGEMLEMGIPHEAAARVAPIGGAVSSALQSVFGIGSYLAGGASRVLQAEAVKRVTELVSNKLHASGAMAPITQFFLRALSQGFNEAVEEGGQAIAEGLSVLFAQSIIEEGLVDDPLNAHGLARRAAEEFLWGGIIGGLYGLPSNIMQGVRDKKMMGAVIDRAAHVSPDAFTSLVKQSGVFEGIGMSEAQIEDAAKKIYKTQTEALAEARRGLAAGAADVGRSGTTTVEAFQVLGEDGKPIPITRQKDGALRMERDVVSSSDTGQNLTYTFGDAQSSQGYGVFSVDVDQKNRVLTIADNVIDTQYAPLTQEMLRDISMDFPGYSMQLSSMALTDNVLRGAFQTLSEKASEFAAGDTRLPILTSGKLNPQQARVLQFVKDRLIAGGMDVKAAELQSYFVQTLNEVQLKAYQEGIASGKIKPPSALDPLMATTGEDTFRLAEFSDQRTRGVHDLQVGFNAQDYVKSYESIIDVAKHLAADGKLETLTHEVTHSFFSWFQYFNPTYEPFQDLLRALGKPEASIGSFKNSGKESNAYLLSAADHEKLTRWMFEWMAGQTDNIPIGAKNIFQRLGAFIRDFYDYIKEFITPQARAAFDKMFEGMDNLAPLIALDPDTTRQAEYFPHPDAFPREAMESQRRSFARQSAQKFLTTMQYDPAKIIEKYEASSAEYANLITNPAKKELFKGDEWASNPQLIAEVKQFVGDPLSANEIAILVFARMGTPDYNGPFNYSEILKEMDKPAKGQKIVDQRAQTALDTSGKGMFENTVLLDIQEMRADLMQFKQTEAFMRWFENSVIADDDGNPIMMYHGTSYLEDGSVGFDEFAVGDIGYHFGTVDQANNRLRDERAKREGAAYRGQVGYGDQDQIIPVFLSIQKPLRMKDVGMWNNPGAILSHLAESGIAQALELEANGLDMKALMNEMVELESTRDSNESFEDFLRIPEVQDIMGEIRRAIQQAGYDGIVYENMVESNAGSQIGVQKQLEVEKMKADLKEKYPDLPDVQEQWSANNLNDAGVTVGEYEAWMDLVFKDDSQNEDSYIAFDAGQVKSPFNHGQWDRNNPKLLKDIRAITDILSEIEGDLQKQQSKPGTVEDTNLVLKSVVESELEYSSYEAELKADAQDYKTPELWAEAMGYEWDLLSEDSKGWLQKMHSLSTDTSFKRQFDKPGDFASFLASEQNAIDFIKDIAFVIDDKGKFRDKATAERARYVENAISRTPAISKLVHAYIDKGHIPGSRQIEGLIQEIKRSEALYKFLYARVKGDINLGYEAMQDMKEVPMLRRPMVVGAAEGVIADQQKILDAFKDHPFHDKLKDKSLTIDEILSLARDLRAAHDKRYENNKGSPANIKHEQTELAAYKLAREVERIKGIILDKDLGKVDQMYSARILLLQEALESGRPVDVETLRQITSFFYQPGASGYEVSMDWAARVQEMLNTIFSKPMKDWSLEDLEYAANYVKKLKKAGREYLRDKQLIFGRAAKKDGTIIYQELEALNKKHKYSTPGSKENSELKRKISSFSSSTAQPAPFYKKYMGKKAVELLFSEEVRARREKYNNIDRRKAPIIDYMKSIPGLMQSFKKEVFIEGLGGKNKLSDTVGTDMTITMSQLMGLRALVGRREGGFNQKQREAAIYGLFYSADEKAIRNETGVGNPNDIDAYMKGQYEDKLNRLLDAIDQYIPVDSAHETLTRMMMMVLDNDNDWIRFANAVYQMSNVEIKKEPFYFTMMRDGTFEEGEDLIRDKMKAMGFYKSMDDGITIDRKKIRPNAQKPIQYDIMKVFFDTLNKQEHLINMGIYAKHLHGVFNHLQWSQALNQKIKNIYGREMLDHIQNHIETITNPIDFDRKADGSDAVYGLRGAMVFSTIGFRASNVLMQMLISPLPGLAEAPLDLMQTSLRSLANPIKFLHDVEASSSMLRHRQLTVEEAILRDRVEKGVATKIERYMEVGLRGITYADRYSVAVVWEAVRQKYLRETGNAEHAIQMADEWTMRTQPTSEGIYRSPMYRNMSGWKQLVLQFTHPLNVIYNNLRYDVPDAVREHNYMKAAMMITAYGLSGLAMGLVYSLRGYGPGDDADEEARLRWWLHALTQQYTDAIPFVGSWVTDATRGMITGEPVRMINFNEQLPAAAAFRRAVAQFVNMSNNGRWDDESVRKLLLASLEGPARVVGMPIGGFKEAISLINRMQGR